MNISMGGRSVGDGEPCLIAAEIAENYNGDVDLACALIEQAALAGADAVKFQTITAEELFNPSSPSYTMRKGVELDLAHYPRLVETAKSNNVIFFSTPFDEPSADFLDDLGVPFFKIGSGELTHHALLRHVAHKGKPMIISTGMAEQEWIDAAVQVIKHEGNDQIIVSHCVSVYPADVRLANVRAIPALQGRLGTLVGYSDHTMSASAAMAAVALGACYLEKHFTLSRALPEGDNSMSNEPQEFAALVEGIREVEAALGSTERTVLPEERPLLSLARRGIYARRTIRRGEVITEDLLAVRRPLSNIAADQIRQVFGKVATTDITAEDAIHWDQLEG